jgi:hypothetical protein
LLLDDSREVNSKANKLPSSNRLLEIVAGGRKVMAKHG